MRNGLGPRGLIAAAALAMLGLAVVAGRSPAHDNGEQLLAYLREARYITSAKCKLCHKTEHGLWAETQHAKNAEAAPWVQADAEGGPPPAELVYRYVTGFNPDDGTWAEKGTGCEACHGPGSAHMAAKSDQRKATIVNPDHLDTTGMQVSLCARCHAQYSIGEQRYAAGFLPGQDLLLQDGFTLDPVAPGKKLQELNELSQSKHLAHGVVCLKCHEGHGQGAAPHQLRKPIVELCTECHHDKQMAAHAPQAPEGATCATCHMPEGQHLFVLPPAGQ